MGEGLRALVRLSAALSTGDRDALAAAMDAAAAESDPVEAEEVLLQSYLFLGYPAALNAISMWRERTGRPAPQALDEDPGAWPGRGAEVCARVYAGQYDRLRANIARLHPDAERWMRVEGYGKVLGRPGAGLPTRELCIAALLAGLDAAPQLYAHLRGALNVGAAVGAVEEAVRIAGTLHPPERARAARAVWEDVLGRWENRTRERG